MRREGRAGILVPWPSPVVVSQQAAMSPSLVPCQPYKPSSKSPLGTRLPGCVTTGGDVRGNRE